LAVNQCCGWWHACRPFHFKRAIFGPSKMMVFSNEKACMHDALDAGYSKRSSRVRQG